MKTIFKMKRYINIRYINICAIIAYSYTHTHTYMMKKI